MSVVDTQILTDSWIPMAWDSFLSYGSLPELEKAKGYYFQGHGRFEMLPVGRGHAGDHALTSNAINLFCILKSIPMRMFDNCSYRKAGYDECQPDLSVYVGDNANKVPATGGVVYLDKSPVPDLAVEISKTSILDDLGTKRSLYEALGFAEYWVVNVESMEVTAFEIAGQGSQRIRTSALLPGFEMAVLEEALRRSREMDQMQVGAWLLETFQAS
ncbi:MAG: Uma2 family endonuclease [Cyanobacteria bacterium P01_F01_bin.53]